MPISGHLVHMPGHIYLRVGEYEKAIDINERSQIVDQQFAEIWGETNLPMIGTYSLSHKSHAPHALDFVRYANMLQGNYAESQKAAHSNAQRARQNPMARRSQKTIAHEFITDKVFGKWDKILADDAANSQLESPYLQGIWSYVVGSAHLAKGQTEEAQAALAVLQEQIAAPGLDDLGVGPTPASHVLNLALHALLGEIAEANDDWDGAILHYGHAVGYQDNLSYTEPPDWSQSMRLYLGSALLEANRGEEAEKVFREELEWSQQNGWATFGLYQALEAQGMTHEAAIAKRQFDSLWRNADVTLERPRL